MEGWIAILVRRYTKASESEAARKVFDGRTFDGNTISASYVSEQDYRQAEAGIWAQAAGALPPPPGDYTLHSSTLLNPKPSSLCGAALYLIFLPSPLR